MKALGPQKPPPGMFGHAAALQVRTRPGAIGVALPTHARPFRQLATTTPLASVSLTSMVKNSMTLLPELVTYDGPITRVLSVPPERAERKGRRTPLSIMATYALS